MITFLRTTPPVANSSQSIGPAVLTFRLVRAHKGTGSAHHGDTIDALPAGGRPQPLDIALCRTGARDRDAESPALLPTAATGTSRRTLAALTEQPLTVSEDAVGTPGDLSQCRERGWPRLAVVESLSQRRLLCAGSEQPATPVISIKRYEHDRYHERESILMGMVDAVPVRNRKYVRKTLLAMWLRITEDGEVSKREIHEFHEAVEGAVRFADANAATYMVEQAAGRSTDLRHFGDLVAVRNAAVTNLPDIA